MTLSISAQSEEDITSGESEKMRKLHAGIHAIDPTNADKLLPILIGQLQDGQLERALQSRSFLAFRYGLAKKELQRREAGNVATCGPAQENQTGNDKAGDGLEVAVSCLEVTSSQSSSNQDVDMSTVTEEDDAETPRPLNSQSQADPLPIEISDFAALPAAAIIKRLAAPDSDGTVQKYGLVRPTKEYALQLAKWILGLQDKGEKEKRDAIAWQIGKRLTVS